MKKVAVTGGLSSGKSTVCRIFKELGAYVVSADEIVHQLLSPDTSIGQKVVGLVGSEIIVKHSIDRTKVAKKVFNNPDLLKSLEEILHPAVREEIEKQYSNLKNNGSTPLFVAEIPLLFESNLGKFDISIAVLAPAEACRNRFAATSGYDKSEYDKRMMRQLSPEEKGAKADIIINNDGSMEDLRQSTISIYRKLTQDDV